MVTEQQRNIVLYVIGMGVYPLVALFGIVANTLNIIVFRRNGFAESTNVLLFGLAISDLCSLIISTSESSFGIPVVMKLDRNSTASEIGSTFPGFLISAFYYVTCFISVFINIERCLCFVLPLRVKTLITPRRSVLVVVATYAISILTVPPAYIGFIIGRSQGLSRNQSTFGASISRTSAKRVGEATSVLRLSLTLSFFVALFVSNVALAVILRRQAEWRTTMTVAQQQSKTGRNPSKSSMSRNIRAGRMIQMVSLVLFVSYCPLTALAVARLCEPKLFVLNRYGNLYMVCLVFVKLILSINSSIYIIFYYRMNPKFRSTFDKIVRRRVARVGVFFLENAAGNTTHASQA